MPRYNRWLCEECSALLLPDGALQRLIPETTGPALENHEAHAIDLHFREGCTLMWYHGGTRLLVGKLRCGGPATGRIVFTADNAYKELSPNLMRREGWGLMGVGNLIAEITLHLGRAAERAPNDAYRNRKEGYHQNKLCHVVNRQWHPGQQWLIIDRECVLGFDNGMAKKQFYSNIKRRYSAVREALQRQDRITWGSMPMAKDGQRKPKEFGDELDMLILGPDRRLSCVELKHGSNGDGIYWGGLQVLVYHRAFSAVMPQISEDIKQLVRQKVGTELLPEQALRWLPPEGQPFQMGVPVLAVAAPLERSTCWEKLRRVMSHVSEPGQQIILDRLDFDPTGHNQEIIQCA